MFVLVENKITPAHNTMTLTWLMRSLRQPANVEGSPKSNLVMICNDYQKQTNIYQCDERNRSLLVISLPPRYRQHVKNVPDHLRSLR